jgi:hypothetical protein
VIFLLSTGASIPAQIGGVQSLVNKFLQELQEEDRKSYFETTNKIRTLLSEWKTDQNQAVIEILLETIERLENKHWTWYFFSIIKKRTFEKYKKLDLDLSKPKLSNIVKRFKK